MRLITSIRKPAARAIATASQQPSPAVSSPPVQKCCAEMMSVSLRGSRKIVVGQQSLSGWWKRERNCPLSGIRSVCLGRNQAGFRLADEGSGRVDIDRYDLAVGRRNAAAMDRGNLAFAAADGRRLPFGDHVFDAVLCHSVLETLSDAASVLVELRRIIRRGGVIGAASVEYGGIIFGGAETAGLQRFYDIR